MTVRAGNQRVTVEWAAVAGASSYEVYHSAGAAIPASPTDTVTGLSKTVSGLDNGVVYNFWVKAVNATGSGAASPMASGTPAALTPGLYRSAERIGGEKTVSLNANGHMFKAHSGVTLALDENITLAGRSANNAPLVDIDGGNLIMYDGAKISGNAASANGGGASVSNGAFTMHGGEISGNTASFGGGVLVDGGTFTMHGGKISGNTVSSDSTAYGGGVAVGNNGTFTMTGGKITGNTASSASTYSSSMGGGVCNINSTFTMTGGEITDNTASSASTSPWGGGVCMLNGTFTMKGGKINGNTASAGGGVYVSSGTFTMTNGEISLNTASFQGGGVMIVEDSGTFFTKSGGTITGFVSDIVNGNVVKSRYGSVPSNMGHAVYYHNNQTFLVKRRESTAGPGVNMDLSKSGAAGGWE